MTLNVAKIYSQMKNKLDTTEGFWEPTTRKENFLKEIGNKKNTYI